MSILGLGADGSSKHGRDACDINGCLALILQLIRAMLNFLVSHEQDPPLFFQICILEPLA